MARIWTHAVHAVMAAMILWALFCCGPWAPELPDGAALRTTAALTGLCWVAAIGTMLLPGLPHLPGEKGRTPLPGMLWLPVLILLCGGVLLALTWDAAALGKPLIMGESVRHAAGVAAAVTALGAGTAIAAARGQVCWNRDGLVLQTALGNIRRFGWAEITGYSSYRGSTMLFVSRKGYTLSLPLAMEETFWRYANDRRRALGLGWIPRQPRRL